MSKLFRSLLWTGFVAIGLAACGDDVTVTETPPPPPPTPGILSVQVGPDGASILVGGTQQMTAAVTTQPGAATPTIVWSTTDATKATVSTGGLVTGAGVGSVGIRATATSGTSVGQGVATVNVVAAPTCVVSSVVVTPASADMVVGQTIQASAAVNGTVQCATTVTWSSLTPAVATVNPATGLITAIASGNAVIKATSTADATKSGSAAVTVRVPDPATLSIQSVTALGLPVPLGAVAGQIEVALNVDNGEKVLDRVDVLIGGQVVASQTFTSAAPTAGPSAAPVTVVLSVNTMQVRRPTGSTTLFVPVIFNGQSAISANLYVVGSSTPIASNAVPVVMSNADAAIRPALTLAPTVPLPTVLVGSTPWYTGGVSWATTNYLAFGRTVAGAAAVTGLTWGATLCGVGTSAVAGTGATGITITGGYTCGGVQGAVAPGAFTATVAPAGAGVGLDGSGIFAPTVFSVVGTAFTLGGESRWNVIPTTATTALTVTPASVSVDNVGPTNTVVGTVAANALYDFFWVNGAYSFASNASSVDGGVGPAGAVVQLWTSPTCGGQVVTTPAGSTPALVESTSSLLAGGAYQICVTGSDLLGNAGAASGASNVFGYDNGLPTSRLAGSTAATPAFGPGTPVISATANTTVYNILGEGGSIDGTPLPTTAWSIEGQDTRSGFDLFLGVASRPSAQSVVRVNAAGTSTLACGFTNSLPVLLSDFWVRNGSSATIDCGTGTVGIFTYTGSVYDRANNQSSPVITRNYLIDVITAPSVTGLGFPTGVLTPGSTGTFTISASDDLDLIDGIFGFNYPGANFPTGGETGVRYPYHGAFGDRWDGTFNTVLNGAGIVHSAGYMGRFDETCTAAAAPYPSCVVQPTTGSAVGAIAPADYLGGVAWQPVGPTAAYVNVRDAGRNFGPGLTVPMLITQTSSAGAAPWTAANTFNWSASIAGGVITANHFTPTSVTLAYFDAVQVWRLGTAAMPYAGTWVYCGVVSPGSAGALVFDNSLFRIWRWTITAPTTGACAEPEAAGAGTWRVLGVKGGAGLFSPSF